MEQTKTLIIPCKDEGREFSNILKRFLDYLDETTLVLIVVDDIEDSSLEYLGEIYERSAGLAFALAAAGGLDKPLPEGVDQEVDPINTINDDDPYNILRPEDDIDGNRI